MRIKQTLLAGTAAIALVAGANIVMAQSPGGAGVEKSQGQSGTRGSAEGQTRGQAQDRQGGFTEPRGQAQGQREMQRGQAREGDQRERAGDQRQERGKAAEQRREDRQERGGAEQGRRGASERETTGAASATVTTEQRTRIREHRGALARGRVDRTRINFNISVGTAVPRTVTLYELPPTIIEVVPAWRGYRYILVEDEIIIIDPGSYQIVAVIDA